MTDKQNNPITIRKTKEMDEMLDYWQKKLLLTPTSIMRIGLARLYEYEVNKRVDDIWTHSIRLLILKVIWLFIIC